MEVAEKTVEELDPIEVVDYLKERPPSREADGLPKKEETVAEKVAEPDASASASPDEKPKIPTELIVQASNLGITAVHRRSRGTRCLSASGDRKRIGINDSDDSICALNRHAANRRC